MRPNIYDSLWQLSCCSLHSVEKAVRYFCWHLFSLTLGHGYFQASSESLEYQMPPAVAGATLQIPHIIIFPHVRRVKRQRPMGTSLGPSVRIIFNFNWTRCDLPYRKASWGPSPVVISVQKLVNLDPQPFQVSVQDIRDRPQFLDMALPTSVQI